MFFKFLGAVERLKDNRFEYRSDTLVRFFCSYLWFCIWKLDHVLMLGIA